MKKKTKTITLVCSDKAAFDVDVHIAERSEFVKGFISEMGDDLEEKVSMPVPNVTGETMSKVIEWLKYHDQAERDATDSYSVKDWDKDFIQGFTNKRLHDITQAANYLNIKDLLDVCTTRIAQMLTGKTAAEMRKLFGTDLERDFAPAEVEEIKKDYLWTW